jgi:hypothetical protein
LSGGSGSIVVVHECDDPHLLLQGAVGFLFSIDPTIWSKRARGSSGGFKRGQLELCFAIAKRGLVPDAQGTAVILEVARAPEASKLYDEQVIYGAGRNECLACRTSAA